MLQFLFGDPYQSVPREVKRPWNDYKDLFAAELLEASPHVRMLYADQGRVMPNPRPGSGDVGVNGDWDANGNLVVRRGGHRYMLDRAHWLFRDYDREVRMRQLEQEGERFARECWKAKGNRFMLFVSTYLWPHVPGLRALWHRYHRRWRRQVQVYELVRELAVLRTIIELERKQGSGSGGGGKRKRTTLPARLPLHAAPTSLELH